jgi:hypothetical protein
VRNFFVALYIGAALGRSSYAQLANTTSLVGTVTDSAGAAVAAASITAVNTATNDTYNALTNSRGDYAIEFIKIGTYNVTAKQAGFEVLTKNGITVNYNQTVRTDFTLTIGQITQHVEVTAAAPPISTDDASIRTSPYKSCNFQAGIQLPE